MWECHKNEFLLGSHASRHLETEDSSNAGHLRERAELHTSSTYTRALWPALARSGGCHAQAQLLLESPSMSPLQLNWRIVLVRPRNPLNIGAAARAMANFGLTDLVVVNPYEAAWQETRSAVGAEEVVKSAHAVSTLVEAAGDASVVVGTTSGSRRHVGRELISLADLPAWLAAATPRRAGSASKAVAVRGATKPATSRVATSRRAALLFGSEKTGLSNSEMSYCHALVRIPTSSDCPSMNLGQAVAVCCYEVTRLGLASTQAPATRTHKSDPATLQSLAHLFDRAARVLDDVGYLQPKSREATLLKLRQFLAELRLSNYDARILGGILAQIEWKLGLQSSND
jgi:TrmH family RNA methyltransferase